MTNLRKIVVIIFFILTILGHQSCADDRRDDRRDDKRDDRRDNDKDDLLGKSCAKTPLLNYLGDYANLWKNLRLCDRVADSKATIDRDGRLYLSYRAPLRRRDNAKDLCNCMKKFLMQGAWTKGAKSVCYTECGTVTFLIIGSAHPEFIGRKPVYQGKKPIDALTEVFEIYGNAEVWDNYCFAKTGVNEKGFKRVLWTCKYSGNNLPKPDKLCETIYDYVNGGDGNILDNSVTRKCDVKGDNFFLEVVAKTK